MRRQFIRDEGCQARSKVQGSILNLFHALGLLEIPIGLGRLLFDEKKTWILETPDSLKNIGRQYPLLAEY